MLTKISLPCMEAVMEGSNRDAELCFLSLHSENKRLSCNENGGLSMSENWKVGKSGASLRPGRIIAF